MKNIFDFTHTFDAETVAMRVTTRTQGWHVDGQLSGPPEWCWPDEGESETIIVSIVICVDGNEFPLTTDDPLFARLAPYLQDEAEDEAQLARDWHTLAKNARWERFTEEAEGRME